MLTCLAGCIAGVSFGNFIGHGHPGERGCKDRILIGASMIELPGGFDVVDVKDIIAVRHHSLTSTWRSDIRCILQPLCVPTPLALLY